MSGMVGVLRSLGAGIKHSPSALRSHRFEHDVLPASLHFDEPNPDIPFRDLNLQVAGEAIPLQRRNGTRFAGVSSFGFGGTNAHVVLADAPKSASAAAATEKPSYLMLSAHTKAALAALSSDYWALVEDADTDEIDRIAAAAGHRRERLAERLVVPLADVEALRSALDAAAEQAEDLGVGVRGTSVGKNGAVAFVFSGNGSQWPGIGCSAYEANAAFRRRFDQIDAHFKKLSGWSLKTEMFAADLEARLAKTSIAQPLIFAIQSATNFALKEQGLVADVTLGHSVGEVAAAEAAGILDLETAVRVICFRSLHQEIACGTGSMAVVFGSREAAEALAAEIPGLAVAAHNSPRGFTVSGSASALKLLPNIARAHSARTRKLDLAYPFHSALMDPVEAPLLADLHGIAPRKSERTFISTVNGEPIDGGELDAHYWWRNVREPVLFMEGLQQALQSGARIFVEIGPSATLLALVNDVAESTDSSIAAFSVLDRKQAPESRSHGRSPRRLRAAHGSMRRLPSAASPERSICRPMPGSAKPSTSRKRSKPLASLRRVPGIR
jgi:acyl transferase domain-containing protein